MYSTYNYNLRFAIVLKKTINVHLHVYTCSKCKHYAHWSSNLLTQLFIAGLCLKSYTKLLSLLVISRVCLQSRIQTIYRYVNVRCWSEVMQGIHIWCTPGDTWMMTPNIIYTQYLINENFFHVVDHIFSWLY